MIDTVRWINSEGKVFSKYVRNERLLPGKVRMIDQTLLPEKLIYVEADSAELMFDFIKRLVVRGAPAIGCAAALGLAASAQKCEAESKEDFIRQICMTAEYLSGARPTAVNLLWALNRCLKKLTAAKTDNIDKLKDLLIKEALDILEEDIKMCKSIGVNGVSLLKDGMAVLTHCNAGALATGDYGTALSPIYVAHEKGFKITVYSDETRPLFQGARLTSWELSRAGINVISICDNMAAELMKKGKIDIVIVGADRIAGNGDTANKIGTYGVAILAKYHKIPFYIAAPYSTIDISLRDGCKIPIEQRDGDEIRCGFGRRIVPADVQVFNPAFDVTPASLITGIITERGILRKPFSKNIGKMFAGL